MSINALLFGAGGADESIDLGSWKPRRLDDDELLWIDVEAPDDGDRETIARALKLDDEASAALASDFGSPDAAIHDGATEVRILLPPDDPDGGATPLRILVGEGWVATAHPEPAAFLDEHRERIRDQREFGRLSPALFLVSVLDWQVDAFFRLADTLENEVDQLDDAALRTDRDILDRLMWMRRRVAKIRRILSPHREVYAELARPDFFPDLETSETEALGHLIGRLDRAAEAIGHAREMLIGTFEVHMTRTAQRTNDIMRILTLASVVLLPSVVLAGVMGMNFKVGFFDNPSVFWFVLAGMIAMGISTLWLAHWRGWL